VPTLILRPVATVWTRLLSFVLSLTVLLLAVAPVLATSITTDLWVYQYGDTVNVSGDGFGPAEGVEIVTTDPYAVEVDRGTVQSDDAGYVNYTFTLLSDVPGIYDVVATGLTSGLTAATQFDPPPAVAITFPTATTYNAVGWGAGCMPNGACGTASGGGTVTVQYSMRQVSSGNYWDPGATPAGFSSALEVLIPVNSYTAPNWKLTFQASKFAADGDYMLRVLATQTSGSPSTKDASVGFTIDTAAPNVPTNLTASPSSPSNDSSPTISGNADPGSTVKIYNSSSCAGSVFGSVAASVGGTFSVDLGLTTDQPYDFYANASDAAGNVSACSSSHAAYVFDSTANAPILNPTTSPASGSNENNPLISGTAEVGSTVKLYKTIGCGGAVQGTGIATSGAFTISVSVADNSTTTFYGKVDTDLAGNTSVCSSSSVTYVENSSAPVDTTAPDTTISAGPADGSVTSSTAASLSFSGTDNVTAAASLTFQCSLDGAAYASCTSPQAYSALTPGPHIFAVRAVDQAGNVDATPASRSWTVDTSAPDTTISVGGPADGSITSSTAASFSFSGTDNVTAAASLSFQCSLDGAAFASCTSPQAYSALVPGPHIFAVRAVDQAGNVDATPASRSWTVDTSAPSVTCGAAPSGWQGFEVAIHCTATDSSGVRVGDEDFYLATAVGVGYEDSNASTDDHEVCDLVGNCVTAGPISGLKVDLKAPTLSSCQEADVAWHGAEVTRQCSYTDGGSGAGDLTVDLSTNVGATNEDSNASATVGNSPDGDQACDAVGNCAVAPGPISGNKVDRKAPVITITSPSGPYVLGQVVNATYSCSDGGSGVSSCAGPVASGSPFDTATVGAKSFTVNGQDNVGNASSSTNPYTVSYSLGSCLGSAGHQILQPVNYDGSSVFKKGSTVPAKFRVCDANNNSIGTAGVVSSFKLIGTYTGTALATVDEAVDSTTPDTAFRWSATDQQWIYNVSTKNMAVNKTYLYEVKLNDGTSIMFMFGLK
jgi:hypothetical protein